MSIMLAGIITMIIIVSILDITKGNILQTISVVPIETITNSSIPGNFSIVISLFNYADATCNPVIKATGLEGALNSSSTITANSTCIISMNCTNCNLTGANQQLELEFASTFAMAFAISYTFKAPYFDGKRSEQLVSDAASTGNPALVFRGNTATQFVLSLTTTQYSQIDYFDFFVYNIISRLFNPQLLNGRKTTG